MTKKSKKSIKSSNNKSSKYKKKLNLITIKGNKKRTIKKTFYDKNEYITDLSFIDKYEEDEKERIKIKENENLIKFQNKRLYCLKFCYRPMTNNIELIGRYLEENNNNININKNKNNKNNNDKFLINLNNKCSYLLNQDKNIVAPILYENISNIENNNNKKDINSNIEDKITISNEKENLENQKIKKKKRIRKILSKNKIKKQYFYLHISKKNLINCLLLNEYTLINHILIYLSGMYSGYFEELNKNNYSTLKVDNFNIFLSFNNTMNNNNYYNIEVLGKGKDEYGEYILKGNMTLINNLELFQKENNIIDIKNNNKVIYFGNIFFHKIYNI